MEEQIRIGTRKNLELERERDALDLMLWAVVLIPVFLFVVDGGLVGNQNFIQWLSAANRLIALVATSLLLIHLLLVARIDWIEKILGLDRTTSRHKKLGKPIVYLFFAHLLISVVHHSLQTEQNILGGLIELNLNYFEIGLATLGFALMVLVAVTSAISFRKKYSYETWFYIHLLSYIAVLIAIPHQFVFGTDLIGQSWVATFFVALYLFVFGSIIWFRFTSPLVQSWGLRVAAVVEDKNKTNSIYISGKRLASIPYQAGQFFMLRILSRGMWMESHPFSVSSAPGEKDLRFTIGERGDFTKRISTVKPGVRVILEGPYGIFSERTRTKRRLVMIAGGIGVAPVRSLARSVVCEPGDVTILYRVNDANDAALLAELREISKARGHNLHVLQGSREGSSWMPGNTEKPDHARLLEFVPHLLDSDVYICGPAAWTNSVENTLREINVKNNQIHTEEFAW